MQTPAQDARCFEEEREHDAQRPDIRERGPEESAGAEEPLRYKKIAHRQPSLARPSSMRPGTR